MSFFTIVFSLYGLINLYIFRRGWQAMTGLGIYRCLIFWVFFLFMLSYPVGRMWKAHYCNIFTKELVYWGSFYLAMMPYFFFVAFMVDILRLGNYFFHFFPKITTHHSLSPGHMVFFGVVIAVIFTVVGGHINALSVRVRNINLALAKSATSLKTLRVVVASDIHLGTIVSRNRLEHIVGTINGLQPDLVLLPGDIVDEGMGPDFEQEIEATFRKIHSTYGTYASTGNHEYYGNLPETVRHIEKGNITVLQDSIVKIADAFYLVGRKDLTVVRFGGHRKALHTILGDVDRKLPIIVMDHQPRHLEEAQENGVDLQVSGHTHHGQLFPFNLVTGRLYEVSWGHVQKGDTHYYISCGVGTWGPPVRIGNTPEVVCIDIEFI